MPTGNQSRAGKTQRSRSHCRHSRGRIPGPTRTWSRHSRLVPRKARSSCPPGWCCPPAQLGGSSGCPCPPGPAPGRRARPRRREGRARRPPNRLRGVIDQGMRLTQIAPAPRWRGRQRGGEAPARQRSGGAAAKHRRGGAAAKHRRSGGAAPAKWRDANAVAKRHGICASPSLWRRRHRGGKDALAARAPPRATDEDCLVARRRPGDARRSTRAPVSDERRAETAAE